MAQDNEKINKINKSEILEWAKKRFFLIKMLGGQSVYFDSATNDTTLHKSHLISHLITKGFDYEEAKDAVRNIYLRPIILNPKYVPYAEKIVNIEGNLYPNSWRMPQHLPINIDASNFVDHLIRMLGNRKKAEYLITMLAYRYQKGYIEAKPHVAFYFYVHKGGYGKSLFATTLENVFGKTAVRTVTDESALGSMSAVDIWTRTWLIVQEVDVKKGSTNYNLIKTMTGGNEFDAARKHENFQTHKCPAQLIMLSNDAPHFLEQYDRRFFVSKWCCEFGSEKEKNDYFNKYINWLENCDGYSAIAYLFKNYDISKFDLAAHAMMTEEKEAVLNMSVDSAVSDIIDILEENPDVFIWEVDDFYEVLNRHDLSRNAIKYKLEQAELVPQNDIRISGKRKRIWLRNGYRLESKSGVPAIIISSCGEVTNVNNAKRIIRPSVIHLN